MDQLAARRAARATAKLRLANTVSTELHAIATLAERAAADFAAGHASAAACDLVAIGARLGDCSHAFRKWLDPD